MRNSFTHDAAVAIDSCVFVEERAFYKVRHMVARNVAPPIILKFLATARPFAADGCRPIQNAKILRHCPIILPSDL
jgi:hypothetical protein